MTARILHTALFLAILQAYPSLAQALDEQTLLPEGYHRWTLPSSDGSTLVFYTDLRRLDPELPLAVWMQGSGYNSVFPVREGEVRNGAYTLVNDALGPDIQTLTVEKRGVPFGLVGGGAALEAPTEYHEHATLESRTLDIILELSALSRKAPLPDRLLAIGHSEGADVAANLAARYRKVTHLAFLAGGGPSQLYDFMTLIRKGSGTPQEKEARIRRLWEDWEEIQAAPESTSKLFQGHAFKRWSSYMSQPPLDNMLRTRAKILMVQGTADTSTPVESADLAAVELDRAGRPYRYLRLVGADHSLRTQEERVKKVLPFIPLGPVIREFFLQ